MQDIYNQVGAVQSIAPQAITADVNGSSADLAVGMFDRAVILIAVGAYTDGTHTFEVQESADNSAWSAVADANLEGTEPVIDAAGDANAVHKIRYTGTSRYLRVVVTSSGTTSGALFSATILKTNPKDTPVA